MIKYFIKYYLMCLSLSNIYIYVFFNFTYPLRCLRVPRGYAYPRLNTNGLAHHSIRRRSQKPHRLREHAQLFRGMKYDRVTVVEAQKQL
jgi:hypothetical protein